MYLLVREEVVGVFGGEVALVTEEVLALLVAVHVLLERGHLREAVATHTAWGQRSEVR